MNDLLDERTLREGVTILTALERAGLTGDVRQTSAYVDDQRDPTPAEYAVTLKQGAARYGTLTGPVTQIAALLGAVNFKREDERR